MKTLEALANREAARVASRPGTVGITPGEIIAVIRLLYEAYKCLRERHGEGYEAVGSPGALQRIYVRRMAARVAGWARSGDLADAVLSVGSAAGYAEFEACRQELEDSYYGGLP